MDNSPSNIYKILLLLERYHQHSQVVVAATDINGLYKRGVYVGGGMLM